MTLRHKTFSAIRWTTFSSLTRAGLQLAQLVIMARILTPIDFGQVAVVVGIVAFLQNFSDAGVSNAIIHFRDISQRQLSSLYWLNIVVSFILALLLALSSHLVASWYQQPNLQFLLIITGVTMLLSASAQQLRIVAQKNLRFSVLAKIELLSSFIGFAVAVSSALLGLGVYSLIIGGLISAFVSAVLAWFWLADGWKPELRLNFDEIKVFLKFGSYMVGNNLASMVNSQIDILLGGKILGVQAIGLYSLPKDLSLNVSGVINPIVTKVGLPMMATAQNDKLLLRKFYLQTMRMTSSINFPIYIAMAFFAPEIVQLFLGDKWQPAIPLLRLLACWALIRSTGNPVGSLLMALGRADLSFKWNMALLFFIPPMVMIGSEFGVTGMAISMISIVVVGYIPNWYFLVRPLCGASLLEYSTPVATPLIIAIVAGIGSFAFANFFIDGLVRLVVGTLVGGILYLLLSLKFNKAWVSIMKEMLLIRRRNEL